MTIRWAFGEFHEFGLLLDPAYVVPRPARVIGYQATAASNLAGLAAATSSILGTRAGLGNVVGVESSSAPKM